MKVSDYFQDLIYEEYCIYLENLDVDTCPMSYEAWEWIKIREKEEENAETYA